MLSIILFMVLNLSGFSSNSAVQKSKSPDPKITSQQAWQRLNNVQTLGEVQLVQMGGKEAPLQVDMAKIKSALEKAGVNEQVSIFFADTNGNLFSNLGSYKPDKIGVKTQAPNTAPSTGQTHQPSAFSTMPPFQPLQSPSTAKAGTRGVKMKPGTVYLSKVIFKDGLGAIKATLQIQISVPSTTTTKGKKKNKG